jgi:DNA-binding GntR family transcriptional regulator
MQHCQQQLLTSASGRDLTFTEKKRLRVQLASRKYTAAAQCMGAHLSKAVDEGENGMTGQKRSAALCNDVIAELAALT